MSDAFTSKKSVVIEVIVRLYGLGVEIYDETHRSFFFHEKEDKSPCDFHSTSLSELHTNSNLSMLAPL